MILRMLRIYFLSSIVTTVMVIYFQKKILNKEIQCKKINLCFYLPLLSIFTIFNAIIINNFLRYTTITFIVAIFTKFIFVEKFDKCLISSLLQQFILFLSEIFIMVIFSLFKINIFNILNSNSFLLALLNLIIFINAIFIYNLKFIKKYCDIIIKNLIDYKKIHSYILLIIFLFMLNSSIMIIYSYENNKYIILLNLFFIIVYSLVTFFFIHEKYKSNIYLQENQYLLVNLNEYEKMLDYQRVLNHENKNQLLVIKGMLENKTSDIINYIDEIIKDVKEDNENLYYQAKKIPTGGLQGLIYQKMLQMQNENIKINLKIEKNIKKLDCNKFSTKLNYDLCRIVGIILDNAIEETRKNTKNKEIFIHIYIDEFFTIEISNYFTGIIELDKIYKKGYTTKEKGHGYGLCLLNDIVNNNKNIKNEISIINNIFVQKIKIKM